MKAKPHHRPKLQRTVPTSRFRAWIAQYGVARLARSLRLHAFRHTAASVMIRAGINPKVNGSILRHQDGGALAMTLYTHILGNDEVSAMDKLGSAICGSPRKRPGSELRPVVSGSFASSSIA